MQRTYIILIVFLATFFIGLSLGTIFILSVLSGIRKRCMLFALWCKRHWRRIKQRHEIRKEAAEARRAERKAERRARAEEKKMSASEPAERPTGLLQRRLSKNNDSWTDFNCSVDHIDESAYISASRRKQDHAYQYASREK